MFDHARYQLEQLDLYDWSETHTDISRLRQGQVGAQVSVHRHHHDQHQSPGRSQDSAVTPYLYIIGLLIDWCRPTPTVIVVLCLCTVTTVGWYLQPQRLARLHVWTCALSAGAARPIRLERNSHRHTKTQTGTSRSTGQC